ncbi:MAG: LEA type 2 family protein [Woeseiaceae bacterium]
MFRQGRKIRLASIATVLALTACASTGSFIESPSITLTNIRSGQMSFDRQNFVLEFDIHNPNAFPLPIRALRYDLQIADQRFASGETQGEITVPAAGAGSVAISVELDMLQQASRLASMLRVGSRGNLPYKVSGDVTVDIPMTRPVPFSNSGSISLTQDR